MKLTMTPEQAMEEIRAERQRQIEIEGWTEQREVARALGWHERRVTRLGLNGRTPGSYLWFPPFKSPHTPVPNGSRHPPNFTGRAARSRPQPSSPPYSAPSLRKGKYER